MYGKRARIGCIIPSTNTVVESEFNKIKPEGVSVHASRIKMTKVTPHELQVLANNVPAAAKQIATARMDVILFACTSGSFFGGVQWEKELLREMESSSNTKCITTSGAVVAALHKFEAKKIVMATPYTDAINLKEKEFFYQNGIEVLRMEGLQKTVNTEIGDLEPRDAYEIACRVAESDADALFISCTDFRTIEVFDKLERETGLPVVTSNQASFWWALRISGIADKINDLGKLFLLD